MYVSMSRVCNIHIKVERDLGTLLAQHQQHLGPQGDESLNDIFRVLLDGPKVEEDLVTSDARRQVHAEMGAPQDGDIIATAAESPGCGYELRLTSFTAACTKEWVRRHGRRYNVIRRVAKPRRAPAQRSRDARPGTDKAVMRGQKKALDRRVRAASAARGSQLRSMFGAPVAGRRVPSDLKESKKFKSFKALTLRKAAAQVEQRRLRRKGLNPYPCQGSRRGRLFHPQPVASTPRTPLGANRPSCIRCLNLSGVSLAAEKAGGYLVLAPPVSAESMARVHMVILQNTSLMDTMPDDDMLYTFLAIVALGITVVSAATWQRSHDPFESGSVVRHVPARERVPMSIVMTATFAATQKRYHKLLTHCSSAAKSKWTVAVIGDSVPGERQHHLPLRTLADVRKLIQRVRRICRNSEHFTGTMFPKDMRRHDLARSAPATKKARNAAGGGNSSLRELFETDCEEGF